MHLPGLSGWRDRPVRWAVSLVRRRRGRNAGLAVLLYTTPPFCERRKGLDKERQEVREIEIKERQRQRQRQRRLTNGHIISHDMGQAASPLVTDRETDRLKERQTDRDREGWQTDTLYHIITGSVPECLEARAGCSATCGWNPPGSSSDREISLRRNYG